MSSEKVFRERSKLTEGLFLTQSTQVLHMLRTMRADLLSLLRQTDPGAHKTKLKKLLRESNHLIKQTYAGIQEWHGHKQIPIAESEMAFVISALESSIIPKTMIRRLSKQTLKSLVSETLTMGAITREWWEKQELDFRYKFMAQMRMGILEGETYNKLAGRISRLMPMTSHNAKTLVITANKSVASEIKLATYKNNTDVVKEVKFSAWLDSKTTEICRSLHGKRWPLDSLDIKQPPRHWRCRSELIPITYTLTELRARNSQSA